MKVEARPLVQGALPSVSRTLPFWVEPAHAFSAASHLPGAVLLESQSPGGRWSIICIEPFEVLRSTGAESPFDALRDVLRSYPLAHNSVAQFAGGAVGYFGYGLRTRLEDVPASAADDWNMPDCWMGLYDSAIVFDHRESAITINACMFSGEHDAKRRMARLEDLVRHAGLDANEHIRREHPRAASSSFTRAGYCAAVNRVKEYIAAGDVYQVNISQRYESPLDISAWDMYLLLRERNPAPFAAYLNLGDFQVVSSSPELFLKLDPVSRLVVTKPIKGTRPRHPDPAKDQELISELVHSEKDQAENVMIVDLERNDLGRVCEIGSVAVPELASVESYPNVHHLVSTVTGRLRRECDAVDLLKACFPGGSITGAPKIRAMEIIHELEPVPRGVYTGSIGYLGFDGSVNLSIVIRTAVVKDGVCRFHVGGGIVADSDPEMEYQETLDKGRAFFEVLSCM